MSSNDKSDNQKQCPICLLFWHKKGFGSHRKRCEKAEAARQRTTEFLTTLAMNRAGRGQEYEPSSPSTTQRTQGVQAGICDLSREVDMSDGHRFYNPPDEPETSQRDNPILQEFHDRDTQEAAISVSLDTEEMQRPPLELNARPPNPPPLNELQPDSILTDYHPSSGKPRLITPLQNHGRISDPEVDPEKEPWRPFRTRLDFELAELALEVGFNKSQMARYVALIHQAINAGQDSECGFTITSQAEVETLWDLASKQRVKFQKSEIEVEYKGTPRQFTFQHRDPWEWILEMVRDARLAPNMAWEAQRMYRWDGSEFERFVDEPWTAEAFWQAQSELPEGASPIALILYADKNKLSTFGTAKGYPIVARLGNLPAKIRNTEGLGGGRVVGWLPIVHEDTKETGKPAFVNFKNAVWHESFLRFLESLRDPACVGSWVTCGDGIMRWLWLIILIFSADYEENTTVTLTRGGKSHFPCPVCLVPNTELSLITNAYRLRTQAQSEEKYNEAASFSTKQEGEGLLKQYGLRFVKNAFWSLPHCDIHRAVSYDTLHSDDNGLWEDHFFKQFKAIISARHDIVKIDEQFSKVPRWSGLNHFNSVMNISFNDGSKNRDIASTFIYAAVCVLSQDRSSEGYQLLKTLRHYLNVRMYADFDLHTTSSILDGRQALKKFDAEMQKYIALVTPALADSESSSQSSNSQNSDAESESEDRIASGAEVQQEGNPANKELEAELLGNKVKSWNFPKMHLRSHLFDDIVSKGATRNFSTKPNEKMHGPIRKYYQRRTNFKNYGDQILKADEFLVASSLIRSNLDYLDSWSADQNEDAICVSVASSSLSQSSLETAEYDRLRKLGSPGGSIAYQELENMNKMNATYVRFRIRLQAWLTSFLRHYGILSPADRAVSFKGTDLITTYQLLRVKYASLSDWKEKMDRIRCHPNFHHGPRYDSVFVYSEDGPYLAKLLMLFTCSFQDCVYPIAFIQPYSAVYKHGNRPGRDIDLELLRLRPTAANQSQFISVHSILRGAIVVQSGEEGAYANDYFLYDLLDPDMFLRSRRELRVVTTGT